LLYLHTDVADAIEKAAKQTEVFFVPASGPSSTGSSSARQPIIITQNIDSVTSSVVSSMMTDSGPMQEDDEVNSDDFCMIDDAGWGKTVSIQW